MANDLKAGDVLELMTPTGQFGTPLNPLERKHYVGLVAGSGITPVLSILATTLEIEAESRFTLIYGNRTKESTMFRTELDRLESRYADRLEILHVMSNEPLHTPELRGRIDTEKLNRWLTSNLSPETVDEWFICGPMEMTTTVRDSLIEHGVDTEHIHLELFFGYNTAPATDHGYEGATVTFTLSGRQDTFDLTPETRSWRARYSGAAMHPMPAWAERAAPAEPNSSKATWRWTTTSRLVRPNSTRVTS